MVKGKFKVPVFLFTFSVVVLFLGTFVYAQPNYSYVGGCGSGYTEIFGMGRDGDDDYGAHIYVHDDDVVITDYKLCFKEQYDNFKGEWKAEFTDKSCDDLDTEGNSAVHVLDVHDLDLVEDPLGSHVSRVGESGSSGKLCIWHTGLMEADGVSKAGEDYLVGTLAKETNSHIGGYGWSDEEVWLDWNEDIDDYNMDVEISNDGSYRDDCEAEEICWVELDPDESHEDIWSRGCLKDCLNDPDRCLRYPEYMKQDGSWGCTEVEVDPVIKSGSYNDGRDYDGYSYSDVWEFEGWDDSGACEKPDNGVINISDYGDTELEALFKDILDPETYIEPDGTRDAVKNHGYEGNEDRGWASEQVEFEIGFDVTGPSGAEYVYWHYDDTENLDDVNDCPAAGSGEYIQEGGVSINNPFEDEMCPNGEDKCNYRICYYGEDVEGNVEDVQISEPFKIDPESPDVTATYNTTVDGSGNVTRERDVTFSASAFDDMSGIEDIYIRAEIDDSDVHEKICDFDSVGSYYEVGPESANCSMTVDSQHFDELDGVDFNATATNFAGLEETDEGSFVVCGVSSMTIGNDIGDGDCDGKRIRGEDCQDGQYAGFEVTAMGECPPLFINASASSTVNVNEDDINENILHPKAKTNPVLSECEAFYGAGGDDGMDGIYQEGGFGAGEVPSGSSLDMDGAWNVGDIPYYCRGEILEAGSFSVYEHEDQQDGEVGSPEEGILIGGSDASGEITLDPTVEKMEFMVPEEENIRTGLWEYVIPMNVTNWNNRPVVVRMSWESQVNLEESWPVGWDYNFTREFWAGRTSYDSFNPYNYNRRVYVKEGNRDIQLKLGDRGGQKNLEEFALVVRAPYGAHSGPRPGEVSMTRDESILYP